MIDFGANKGTRKIDALGAIILCTISALANYQQSFASPGAKLQGGPAESGKPVIRDALNRPCLDIEAISRPHVVNPALVDHIVSVKNGCPRLIAVKVCYFGTEQCKSFSVSSYQRTDVTLGTMTKSGNFRYTVFQK